jgi:HEAT repeat protein
MSSIRQTIGILGAGLVFAGCGGISDCKEDGAKCAEMLAANADKCAVAYILKQSESKRKDCENAVKVIRKTKPQGGAAALLKLIEQPSDKGHQDRHQMEAATALGDLGDASAADGLVAAIDYDAGTSSDWKDKNGNRTNEEICDALALLKPKSAVDPLLKLIDKTRERNVILKAVRALGEIKDPKAVPKLIDIALNHENKFLRKNAVEALGTIGDPSATDALIQMMFIEFKGVSFYKEASYALFQIGPAVTDKVLETMALKNEKVNKIFEAAGGMKETAIKAKCGYVLGDLRDPRAVDPLIEAFEAAGKEPMDPVILGFAPAPMAALGDKKAAPALRKQMLTLDPSIRDGVMRALNQLGDTEAVPKMMEGMDFPKLLAECIKIADKESCESDPNVFGLQKTAIDHVSNLAQAEHLDAFKKIVEAETKKPMQDYMKERMVRVEAAAECKQDSACWVKKLEHQDPLVRERAAWELGRIKDPSTLDALGKVLADKKPEVRSAAIMSYWNYGDGRVIPAIEKQLADERAMADFIKVNEDLKRLMIFLQRKKA